MNVVLLVIGTYLLLGLGSLAIFDAITGRLRSRLRDASYATQEKLLMGPRVAVGSKLAIVVTLLATWLFWPLVIYSAVSEFITDRLRRKK